MPKLETDAPAQKIEIVRAFLKRLDGFKSREGESIPLLGQFLARFAAERSNLQRKEQSWQMAKAPNFNIFRALGLQRRESKHSRFLAELLDPRGSHAQGDRFLTAFLCLAREFGLHCPSEWPVEPKKNWEITTEEVVSESDRLDIVLRCRRARFMMVIENKIDAPEGYKQLLRYENWLQKQKAEFDFRNLVFLAPDVRQPRTISTAKCLCLSYREHVSDWLRSMIGEIQAPPLQFAISQYLQVLDSF